jgi:predicted anti-sigma-YlaC factor YlaD
MNGCERIEMEVSALLDGAAEAGAELAVLDHVAECSSCREFYLQARALDALAAVAPSAGEPVSAPSFDRIERTAGLTATLPWRQRPGVRWALRIAAAVVVTAGLASVGVVRLPAALRIHDGMKVVVGEDRGQMSDAQFVDLAVTVLRSDSKYRTKMLDLLNAVESDRSSEGERRPILRKAVAAGEESGTSPRRGDRTEQFF